MQVKEWSDSHGGAERLSALLERSWKRVPTKKPPGDLELGIAMIAGIRGSNLAPNRVKAKYH